MSVKEMNINTLSDEVMLWKDSLMKDVKEIPGHIYVLSNPAMPGLLKIGYTEGTAEIRATELSAPTAVPLPFEVAFEYLVEDPKQFERLVHQRLEKYRISSNREFFRVELNTVQEVIYRVVFGCGEPEPLDELKYLSMFCKRYSHKFGFSTEQMEKELIETFTSCIPTNKFKKDL